jgi:hypothetical protein
MRIKSCISCLLILILLVATSCHKKKKAGVTIIPKKEFVVIIVDLHIAQSISYIGQFSDTYKSYDSINLINTVIKKHHYDRASFDTTLQYYTSHADKFYFLYDDVIKTLLQQQDAVFPRDKNDKSKRPEPYGNAPR